MKIRTRIGMLLAVVLVVNSVMSVFAIEQDNLLSPVNVEDTLITGFEDSGIIGEGIFLNKNEMPSLEELCHLMPDKINVRVGGTVSALNVTWECQVDEYERAERYYYQFNPVFEDYYDLSDEIRPEDIPYVPVFIYDDTDEDCDNAFVKEGDSAVEVESAGIVGAAYPNEGAVYNYITSDMGLSTAAACGIMANIQAESSFNPKAKSPGGSYGICQWTGSRFTDLQTYCTNNSLDYTSLEAQLAFLNYELTVTYKTIWNHMKNNISNTEEGAYDAGYYWCYYFERPLKKEEASVIRGNLAKNTYWNKYKTGAVESTDVTITPGQPLVPTLTVSPDETVSPPAVEKRRITADKKFSFIVGDTISVNYPGISRNEIEYKGKAGVYNKSTGEVKLSAKGKIKLFRYEGKKRRTICTIKSVEPKLKKKYTLVLGKEKKLKPKLTVEMGSVLWVSSNKKVVTVKDGVLTPLTEGTAKVTLYVNGHPFSSDVEVITKSEKKKRDKKRNK